jgi:hypothetical protein
VTGTKARNADQEGDAAAVGSFMGLFYDGISNIRPLLERIL